MFIDIVFIDKYPYKLNKLQKRLMHQCQVKLTLVLQGSAFCKTSFLPPLPRPTPPPKNNTNKNRKTKTNKYNNKKHNKNDHKNNNNKNAVQKASACGLVWCVFAAVGGRAFASIVLAT